MRGHLYGCAGDILLPEGKWAQTCIACTGFHFVSFFGSFLDIPRVLAGEGVMRWVLATIYNNMKDALRTK